MYLNEGVEEVCTACVGATRGIFFFILLRTSFFFFYLGLHIVANEIASANVGASGSHH